MSQLRSAIEHQWGLWDLWKSKGEDMKLQQAIYKVQIGIKYRDLDTDNWSSKTVLATNVVEAMKKVSLERGEYFSEVRLLDRVDE